MKTISSQTLAVLVSIALAPSAFAPSAFAQGSLLGVASANTLTPAAVAAPARAAEAYDGDFPDPFVLAVDGGWLAVATNTRGANVPLLRSADLKTWTWAGDAMPQQPAWVEAGRTWAPAILPRGGSYVLYFCAHAKGSDKQEIGCAVSDKPEGPYTSAATAPLIDTPEQGGAIDPSPFVDDDGRAYLLWKNDGNSMNLPTRIWIRELTADGTAFVGPPVVLLWRTAGWENPLVEGPSMVKHDGVYHLFYSGGWWESAGYGVGHAIGRSLTQKFTKTSVNGPLLGSHDDIEGPGGQEFFRGPDGPWVAFHAWKKGQVGYGHGGARSLHVERLGWNGDNPVIGAPAPSTPAPTSSPVPTSSPPAGTPAPATPGATASPVPAVVRALVLEILAILRAFGL